MSAVAEEDLSFTARLQLRERILAWISRDVGLCEFLLPPEMTSTWGPDQRKAWTDAIIDTFLHSNPTTAKLARQRVLSYETAGSLRRGCAKLRNRTADHRDLVKTSVSLETLWDGISTELDDATWARCSLLFDTALISLRVAYLWMYMKAETSSPDVSFHIKKSSFETLLANFFMSAAPTDDQEDKHSDNFRKLLEAWRTELLKYTESDNFDKKMEALEKSQSLDETATCIDKFLAKANVDQSWVLKMQKIDEEMEQGLWTRRKGKGRRRKQKDSPSLQELEIPESASSFEPKDSDSDFKVDSIEALDDDEDNSAAEDDNDSEYNLRRQRADMRTTRHIESTKKSALTTRQGRVRGTKHRRTTRSAPVMNRSRESGEDDFFDSPTNDKAADIRGRQTPPSARTQSGRSHLSDEKHDEHLNVEITTNGFQPQRLAGKRKLEPEFDDEDHLMSVVENETAIASPNVPRTPGGKQRAVQRALAATPRTIAQLEGQEPSQPHGQVRRVTMRTVVQDEDVNVEEAYGNPNGQSSVLKSNSELVVTDVHLTAGGEEIAVTRGTRSKDNRNAARNVDDTDSRDSRRQRVFDALTQKEEIELESPGRPLRRSARTNPNSR